MIEQEKFYKEFHHTFDRLHASPDVLTEVLAMTTKNKVISMKKKCFIPQVAAVAIVFAIVFCSAGVAYAMDLGGIQRIVQVWIHGDQTSAVFTVQKGTYSLDYKDADGNKVHQGGGGVAFNEDGTERPLTEEELWDEINAPNVVYEEDGSVWIYYIDQKMDITDKFEDGVCYLQLKVDDAVRYITVKYQNGYAMSPHGYIQSWEFN